MRANTPPSRRSSLVSDKVAPSATTKTPSLATSGEGSRSSPSSRTTLPVFSLVEQLLFPERLPAICAGRDAVLRFTGTRQPSSLNRNVVRLVVSLSADYADVRRWSEAWFYLRTSPFHSQRRAPDIMNSMFPLSLVIILLVAFLTHATLFRAVRQQTSALLVPTRFALPVAHGAMRETRALFPVAFISISQQGRYGL